VPLRYCLEEIGSFMNGQRVVDLRFKLALFGPAALVIVAAGFCGCGRNTTSSRAAKPLEPSVKVLTVRRMDLPIIVKPTGTTKALNEVLIRARVKGFLKEKGERFTEGANVQPGDLLLVIEEDQFKVRVAQARGKYDAARADLAKAKQSKARETATAQLEFDEAQDELARVEERRESSLLARNASSRENFDRVQASRKKSDAQVKISEANLLQAQADYGVDIQAAQANVEKAQADLKEAEIELGYCRMVSPIKGRIGELQIKPGNLVGQGGSSDVDLVKIEQLDPMGFEWRVPARYLPAITQLVKSNLKVNLHIRGRPAHPYQGTVFFVDNTVDPTTSTVLVKAEVPNPDETILPGEYVELEINIGDYAGALVVPDQAMLEEGQEGARVLVVDAQNKVASARVVPLGLVQGLRALEPGKSQLQEGQKVIVEGVPLVRPGQTVRVESEEAEIESYRRPEPESPEADELDSPIIRLRGGESPAEKAKPADGKSTSGKAGAPNR
jgi:RND family efflux transporter MFP subunit